MLFRLGADSGSSEVDISIDAVALSFESAHWEPPV